MSFLKKYYVQLTIILLVAGILGWYVHSQQVVREDSINSFEDCAAAGYPIMESYPEQCATPGGKHFVREVDIKEITVTGEAVCLPHKGEGPHTLECAYGIVDGSGDYYQVGLPEGDAIFEFMVGEKYTLNGLFTPEFGSQYDIVGSITVADFVQEE